MRTVLVTGASGNLGQAVVSRFLQDDTQVIGIVSRDRSLSFAAHPQYRQVAVNLEDEAATQEAIAGIIAGYQRIDTAVLTAGGFSMGKIGDTAMEDLLTQYKLNFVTAYNVARPVFNQLMKQGSGRLFMIGARPGLDMSKSKNTVAYAMSKSLIFHLSELLNEEARGHDIVSSVIVPSTIDTPQNRAGMPDADFSKWVRPEAIAEIIHFYSSAAGDALREPVIKVYNNA